MGGVWPIISLKQAWQHIFIVFFFFLTDIGTEQLWKVLKKLSS